MNETEKLINYIDEQYDIVITGEFIDLVKNWSIKTFGPGQRTQGILDHIKKEVKEVEQNPLDLEEWIDIMLLAMNGAQRLGYTGNDIIDCLQRKVLENCQRSWPDWKTANTGEAITHIKTDE
jgi:hypothetical protein